MSTKMAESKLAVILVRGTVNTHPDVRKTLDLLRLRKKHACVVVDDNQVNKGMLQKVKDYVTYGTIDEAAFAELVAKRGELVGQEKVADSKVDSKKVAKEYFEGKLKLREFTEKYNLKPFFRLHPPKGGFERGGIKMPFAKGGVLGNRADRVNELIVKML